MKDNRPRPQTEIKARPKEEWKPHLIGDYEFDLVASALQKSIRRSLERDAMFWAGILYCSGFSGYLERRLPVIVNEDCGVANPTALILAGIMDLGAKVKMRDKKYELQKFSGDGVLPIANLISISCRGKKTRLGDELVNLTFDGIKKWDKRLEIPDYAIDPHVSRGKEIWGEWESGTKEESHKRIKEWFDVWSKLDNEDKKFNTYREELKMKWGYYNPSLSPIRKNRKIHSKTKT